MPTIEITPEQAKELAKGNSITLEPKQEYVWKPKKGEEYWTIKMNSHPTFYTNYDDDIDQAKQYLGLCFPTKEAAEAKVEYEKALTTVRNFIKEKNQGWEPDWRNLNQMKFYPIFKYEHELWEMDYFSHLDCIHPFPHCKTKEIAQELIDTHEKELDIIRTYKF